MAPELYQKLFIGMELHGLGPHKTWARPKQSPVPALEAFFKTLAENFTKKPGGNSLIKSLQTLVFPPLSSDTHSLSHTLVCSSVPLPKPSQNPSIAFSVSLARLPPMEFWGKRLSLFLVSSLFLLGLGLFRFVQ